MLDQSQVVVIAEGVSVVGRRTRFACEADMTAYAQMSQGQTREERESCSAVCGCPIS